MRLWPDHRPRAFGRKIVLADVHTREIGSDADVGAIVHDQRDSVVEHMPDFAGMGQHLARRADFVAILNERRAAGGKIARVVDHRGRGAQRRSKAGDIKDGVKLGKIHLGDFVTKPIHHREH